MTSAQTDDVYGVAVDANGKPLEENVQGESQQILDVLCNTIMLRAFCGSGRDIHSVASEEEDDCRCCADVMVRAAGSGFGWGFASESIFFFCSSTQWLSQKIERLCFCWW